MGSMKDLLGDVPVAYPHTPGFKEHSTSKEAAKKIEPKASVLRELVYLSILNAGPTGRTADEVAEALGASILAVRPRVSELAKAGRVQKTGQRHRNDSGMMAHRWRIKVTT